MKTYLKSSNLNNLKSGNDYFINNVDKDHYQKLCDGQNPFAIIITCSDSRVIPENIFNVKAGSLFVIRTAGNVINEGELASIEYGIEHLNIKTVVVLGHTHCGAIHAAIHKEKGKYLSSILDNITRNILDEHDECKATKLNALKQVEYIKEKFPDYDGEVIAMIYDIETLKVDIID